ncbi:hypothetical protein LNP74_21455 [Klebsiella pneumoniae subsp. pneumoniae]|nr:hypothetical protein [Klebsiella pneumoniae subsp. pneumoniae]
MRRCALGTAACPPYHIAFVIGGTLGGSDAEDRETGLDLAITTVRRPKVHEHGQAFRDATGAGVAGRKRRTSASRRAVRREILRPRYPG